MAATDGDRKRMRTGKAPVVEAALVKSLCAGVRKQRKTKVNSQAVCYITLYSRKKYTNYN